MDLDLVGACALLLPFDVEADVCFEFLVPLAPLPFALLSAGSVTAVEL